MTRQLLRGVDQALVTALAVVVVPRAAAEDGDPVAGGTLSDWDDTFAFVLGNEVSGDRQWQGILRMVAVHNRAMTEAQIQQNFAAGVGEKFYLLFSLQDLVSMPEAYILFEVSQFDNYSYLFNQPIFLSLNDHSQ